MPPRDRQLQPIGDQRLSRSSRLVCRAFDRRRQPRFVDAVDAAVRRILDAPDSLVGRFRKVPASVVVDKFPLTRRCSTNARNSISESSPSHIPADDQDIGDGEDEQKRAAGSYALCTSRFSLCCTHEHDRRGYSWPGGPHRGAAGRITSVGRSSWRWPRRWRGRLRRSSILSPKPAPASARASPISCRRFSRRRNEARSRARETR